VLIDAAVSSEISETIFSTTTEHQSPDGKIIKLKRYSTQNKETYKTFLVFLWNMLTNK